MARSKILLTTDDWSSFAYNGVFLVLISETSYDASYYASYVKTNILAIKYGDPPFCIKLNKVE
jgi:hypothetical protein